jgi:hypothetical protein
VDHSATSNTCCLKEFGEVPPDFIDQPFGWLWERLLYPQTFLINESANLFCLCYARWLVETHVAPFVEQKKHCLWGKHNTPKGIDGLAEQIKVPEHHKRRDIKTHSPLGTHLDNLPST